jgi:hypothetical protein
MKRMWSGMKGEGEGKEGGSETRCHGTINAAFFPSVCGCVHIIKQWAGGGNAWRFFL